MEGRGLFVEGFQVRWLPHDFTVSLKAWHFHKNHPPPNDSSRRGKIGLQPFVFSGKKAADQIFDFIEWLTQHTARFSTSAQYLEELIFSKQTQHLFVLTPETPFSFLESVRSFFERNSTTVFVINKSLSPWVLKASDEVTTQEFLRQKGLEEKLLKEIKKKFPKSPVEQIPLMFMGDDTKEELIRFISK